MVPVDRFLFDFSDFSTELPVFCLPLQNGRYHLLSHHLIHSIFITLFFKYLCPYPLSLIKLILLTHDPTHQLNQRFSYLSCCHLLPEIFADQMFFSRDPPGQLQSLCQFDASLHVLLHWRLVTAAHLFENKSDEFVVISDQHIDWMRQMMIIHVYIHLYFQFCRFVFLPFRLFLCRHFLQFI